MAAYYPRRVATIKDLQKLYAPDFETWDDAEEDRFEKIKMFVTLNNNWQTPTNRLAVSKREERVHLRRRGRQKVWPEVCCCSSMLIETTRIEEVQGQEAVEGQTCIDGRTCTTYSILVAILAFGGIS